MTTIHILFPIPGKKTSILFEKAAEGHDREITTITIMNGLRIKLEKSTLLAGLHTVIAVILSSQVL
jgi:hypothetical protein